MQYQIKRGESVVFTARPTGQQVKKVMGENTVTMSLDLPQVSDLRINDYVDVYSERYFLMALADIKKTGTRQLSYSAVFKGWQYLLGNVSYLFPDADNNYTLSPDVLMGNLETFIDLLITNANREQSGWVKGTIDETEYKEVTFSAGDTCLSVLATLANEFKVEWWVVGQTIHMTKRGSVEAFSLAYGQGNGLYDIDRVTSTDKNLCTRLYAYGSEKNIPADYKGYSNRLKLPGAIPYIENNVYAGNNPANPVLYGIIEHTEVFDDIYPNRVGVITAVGDDEFTFSDSLIDFDVNTQLMGVSAKLTFNTGDLAGYTFELNSFDNATKTFRIKVNKNEKAFIIPSGDLKPAVGDQYVLTDIKMPDSYISAAEAALLAKAQEYLTEASNPIVTYSVTGDPLNFRTRNITLLLGNYVPMVDADLGLNDNLRISGFSRDLQIPSLYPSIELAEVITVSPIVRNYVGQENLVKKVNTVTKGLNRTYNDALQAKATADGVKLITDYWGVTIDPDHGIVASGTLLVGSGAVGNAGITGVIDNIDSTDPLHPVDRSVRIWAGAAYEDKETAPFRVTDDGRMVATRGRIAGFDITDEGLENLANSDAFIRQVKKDISGTVIAEAVLGTRSVPFFGDNYIGYFANDIPGNAINNALYCRASGGSDANYALTVDGGIYVNGNVGFTGHFDYEIGGAGYRAFFVSGLFIRTTPI